MTLTTTPLAQGITYTLTVNNVVDMASNPIAADSQEQFQYNIIITGSFQDGVAPTADYAGTTDTYISQSAPTSNFGSSAELTIVGDYGGGSGNDLASLLKWDISSIPPGSLVDSAQITLDVFDRTTGAFQLYELKRDWVEAEASWNVFAAGSGWQTSGAQGPLDRGPLLLGAISPATTRSFHISLGSHDISLNANGRALVQSWINDLATNHGIILVSSSSTSGDVLGVRSSEYGTAAQRPKLTVTYIQPVPFALSMPATVEVRADNGSLSVSWSAILEASGYMVQWKSGSEQYDDSREQAVSTNRATIGRLENGTPYTIRVQGTNAEGVGKWSDEVTGTPRRSAPPLPPQPPGPGGGGGPRQTVPDAPSNLLADGGDATVTLTWDAPEDDGGEAITDYEYRIDRRNPWISTGSTDTTHTVSGLVNGTVYVFEVRAVNRIGKSRASDRAEATPEAPEAPEVLDFSHFANGTGIASDFVLVNLSTEPSPPAIYFYDTEGAPVSADSVVDLTEDLEVTEDDGLTVWTQMEPLGALTISTHGQGELVSGSVKVVSNGLIAGFVRYSVPGVGVAGVGASPAVRDALFPARRQAGEIRTAAALHNLGEEAMGVSCRLMSGGVALEEAEIPLAANGQTSWFIEDVFTMSDTADFAGSVRCAAPGNGRFSAIAVEMDVVKRVFTTLPVALADRGGGGREATLDFAHFANGTGITSDLVFVNRKTEPSGPPPTPFHTAIPPIRPAIYFYDTEGAPVSADSLVDVTGDLEIAEDGALTVRTQMEPLGALTISTHGRGELVSGSVKVVSDGPIGGMLRFDLPHIGEAVVVASPPVSDAIFPVRRQEGGITTGVALHNLESSAGLLRCDLMREGVLLDAASIPLEANGQTSWLIDQAFPAADTSDFTGSVRCDTVGEGLFSAVALEMDPATRTFITLPVFPVPEMPDRE